MAVRENHEVLENHQEDRIHLAPTVPLHEHRLREPDTTKVGQECTRVGTARRPYDPTAH